MKTALILEGGAMRGMYTAAVMDVFLEHKIAFDTIIAVSAGALFGMNMKSHQKGRVLRYNLKYIRDKRYMSFSSLFSTGFLVNKEFCFEEIPYKLDVFDFEEYRRDKSEFYAVVTNIETGKPEYIKIDDVNRDTLEYFRASGSLPYVSKPVEINGKRYLDGGMSDSIPIEKALEMGYDRIVVVLTRPLGYKKTKPLRGVAKLYYRKYPKLAKTINNRWERYNRQTELVGELEQSGKAFVLRPSQLIKMKRIEKDTEKLEQMYKLGIHDITERLGELKKYLSDRQENADD